MCLPLTVHIRTQQWRLGVWIAWGRRSFIDLDQRKELCDVLLICQGARQPSKFEDWVMQMNKAVEMTDPAKSLEDMVLDHHRSQLALCDRLERLADSLPDKYDPQECLSISWQLYPAVKSAHKFEEEELFPKLLEPGQSRADIEKSIERLKFEHWEDESSAEDISMFLRQMISHPSTTDIGKMSYMLRGFFDGIRRHIAFETEYLLPKLREIQ